MKLNAYGFRDEKDLLYNFMHCMAAVSLEMSDEP